MLIRNLSGEPGAAGQVGSRLCWRRRWGNKNIPALAGNLAHLIKNSIYSENKKFMSCLRCSVSFQHDLFYIVLPGKKQKSTFAVTVALRVIWHAEMEPMKKNMTDDIVIWGQRSEPGGGRGTNKVQSSGAPVFINKHHLLFFSWWQNLILLRRIIDGRMCEW